MLRLLRRMRDGDGEVPIWKHMRRIEKLIRIGEAAHKQIEEGDSEGQGNRK